MSKFGLLALFQPVYVTTSSFATVNVTLAPIELAGFDAEIPAGSIMFNCVIGPFPIALTLYK